MSLTPFKAFRGRRSEQPRRLCFAVSVKRVAPGVRYNLLLLYTRPSIFVGAGFFVLFLEVANPKPGSGISA